jgi:pimeloyl-ACP methyl ester carboxylesterase/DNA-binding CsgD family transcriptional regulator
MEMPPVQYLRTSDGYNLAYWDIGEGPTIVLVPSRLNSLRQVWNRFGPWFRPLMAGHRFVSFDARGQGLSTRGLRPDVSMQDYVGDLGLIFDHLAIERAVLLAHGFGGHIAARYAVRHPERVAAIVFATVTVDIRAWNMPFWFGVASENWELFLRSLAPRSLTGDGLEHWLETVRGNETHADYMLAAAVSAQSRIDDVLPSIAAPALVLHPRNYVMVPEEEAPKLAGALPDARMVMLPGDGETFLGDAGAFVDAVTRFIDRFSEGEKAMAAPAAPSTARLSRRETEVLRLIAAGKSNQQIADALVLSLRTVERHITNLYAKIGAHGKADATAYALRHGQG